ncbi:uncharacterized protein F4812DRAFT_167780 [Daldinia caldariorum]|uniref:uncharacterized protein n=1 Tax=Daldinia caldariorum TaxID=326644 RepID=UPI0020085B59|nr:uncharacterized protein F4812DRAFT_167780 [Daldinia caldariorum]KAI1471146.1 hypothetical protein F4812DRAFT_167780 [Daldinia caldariorum]
MSSIHWTHAIRLTKPFGLLPTSKAQLRPTYYNRVSLYSFKHQPGVRSFHFQPVAASVIQTAEDAILAFHGLTHIPWFLSIPIVAVGISLAFRVPFNVYIHRINYRRARFTPVLMGWTGRIARDLRRERVKPSHERKETLARHKKLAKRIYRTVGLQDWKLYSNILGLPFWLLGVESVRWICGGPRGLLGHLILGRAEDDATASNTPGDVEAAISPLDVTTAAADQAATAAEHIKNLPDPSIAFEGCLWFPDLSVPDPYHILPVALSSLLVWNMLPKSQAGLRQLAGLNPEDKFIVETPAITRQRRLRRILIVLCSLIGPMTADLPAALHLYWLSTAGTQTITSKVLAKFMPIDTKVVPRALGVETAVIRPRRVEKEVKAAD